MNTISFTKVALPYGWLGNMSAFIINYKGKNWRTTEALFQALRFEDETIREQIRLEKSPMGAKMKAKANATKMTIVPTSEQDLKNMELVLRLKLAQHHTLVEQLAETGDCQIVEDVSSRMTERNMFWGAGLTSTGWVGNNNLGKLWMKLREELKNG